MAAPIDSALYRMKAYGKLLQENGVHAGAAHDPGDDILALVAWIEYARPLLGAISPDQVVSQVQNQVRGYHGMQQGQQRTNPEDVSGSPTPEEKPVA